MKPLEGLKVVELGVYLAIPGVSRLLADWGAEVIKVEAPKGDASRYTGHTLNLPSNSKCNPVFSLHNSGKKLIGLDLKTPEGMQIMEKLLADADIFLSNIRYGGLARLGLDYESLHKRYPRLVCGYINGYGFEGPEKDKAGFDMTSFWAKSGILNAMRDPENIPRFPPPGIGDTATASMVAAGVLAAVIRRYQTGEGSMVSSSLMAAGIWTNYSHVTAGQDRQPDDPNEPFLTPYPFKQWRNPFYHIYRCKDGRLFFLLGGSYSKLPFTLKAMGLEDLVDDPRYANQANMVKNSDYLYDRMIEVFMQKTADQWAEILQPLDIPYEILATNADVSKDQQAWVNGCLTNMQCPNGSTYIVPNSPVDFSDMEKPQTCHVGGVGADTREILISLGYSDQQIRQLLDQGVVKETE